MSPSGRRAGDRHSYLYDRQKTLNIKLPKSLTVIGVGGVGSWVSLFGALAGIKKIHLIDFDIVEDTNLNRTPFTKTQIGESKVGALMSLIRERRPEANVVIFNGRIETLSSAEISEISSDGEMGVLVDCRDNNAPLPTKLAKLENLMKGGYDGFSVTLHQRPSDEIVFGDEQVTYSTVPSYFYPPVLIGSLIIDTIRKHYSGEKIQGEEIATFDVNNTFSYIMKGIEGGDRKVVE